MMRRTHNVTRWLLVFFVLAFIIPVSVKAGTIADLEASRLALFDAIALEDDALVRNDTEPYYPYATYDFDAYDRASDADLYYATDAFEAFSTDLAAIDYGGTFGIDAINAAIGSTTITESEIDGLIASIDALLGGLITREAYIETAGLLEDAGDTDTSAYTPASVTAFENRLDAIGVDMEDPRLGTEGMLALQDDIDDAYDLLVEKADKTTLTQLNHQAIIAYYEDRTTYTADSYAAFKAAVNAYGNYLSVNDVIDDPNATQAEVESLETTIREALDLLVERVDPEALLIEYEALDAMDLSAYTPASVDMFEAELDRLFEIITGDNLDRTTYDSVDVALDAATDLLVERADVSELSGLLADIDDVRRERYSHASYGHLMDAAAEATELVANENRTPEAVRAMIIRLNERLDALEPRIEDIYVRAGDEPLDLTAYVMTGDATVDRYQSSNPDAFTVDDDGMLIPHAFGDGYVYVSMSNGVAEIIPVVVKADIDTPTIVLMAVLPAAAVGSGVAVTMLNKKSFVSFGRWVKRLFSKKKEG